jgi:2-dehydropantoate 2-reductase
MSRGMTPFRTISVVGAGALGGYYGARLAQRGHDVHFLLRGDYDAVRTNGLTIRSVDGDFTLAPDRVRACRDPREMPQSDLVLVTIKSTANHTLPDLVAPLLHDATAILTLQNGLGNEDLLASRFGGHRVLGGMAFVCINRIAPGVIHHTDHGLIRLGEFAGGRSERANAIAAMFNAARVHAEVLDDLRFGRWEKLVWNVPFNGLGALLDATTDRLIRDETHGLPLVRAIMAEVVAAANANGVRLPVAVIDQKIDATRTMGAYRSSMQVDRRAGRPMEIEAIFGQPLRAAAARGVPTPLLDMLYHALTLLESSLPRERSG